MMNKRNELYILGEQAGFQLRLAYQKSCAIFSASIPDITPTQWAVIAKLNELGECSQNLLGRATGMDTSTIKGVVSRLGSRHLIEILPDALDRRRVSIRLSEEGQQIYNQYMRAALMVGDQLMSNLSLEEKKTLASLLEKIMLND